MYRPASLKKGDTIGLVCPARKISREAIQSAVEWLEAQGFNVLIGDSVGAEYHQYAGDDAVRRKDFQKMMDHPDVKAILACRGGYGTVRILDDLFYGNFINKPKWICGYSDITALHSHLNHVMGISTLHCTMPVNFATNTPEALSSMLAAMMGIERRFEWNAHPLNIQGTMRGEVIGGNLSILYSLLGTKTGLLTSGKILFLEDLDEYLYHIDRMMMAMKRAGKLQGLNGIIVGGMTDMKDNAIPYGKTAEEIIFEHCSTVGIPLVFNFPAGHIDDNRAIILGSEATIEVGVEKCTFIQL
jgi:muramoyltetrapeptide carboxypeptidase